MSAARWLWFVVSCLLCVVVCLFFSCVACWLVVVLVVVCGPLCVVCLLFVVCCSVFVDWFFCSLIVFVGRRLCLLFAVSSSCVLGVCRLFWFIVCCL